MKQRIIELDNLTCQGFLNQYAGFLTCTDERQGYYLCNAILMVWKHPDIILILKEAYGDNYEKLLSNIKYYFKKLSDVKFFLDIANEKAIDNNDLNSKAYKQAHEGLKNIDLIYETLYRVLGILARRTNLGVRGATREAMRIYETVYKHVEYKQDDRYRGQPMAEREQPERSWEG